MLTERTQLHWAALFTTWQVPWPEQVTFAQGSLTLHFWAGLLLAVLVRPLRTGAIIN